MPPIDQKPSRARDVEPRRAPRQDRSKEIVAAVLTSAADLLGQLGVDHVTMTAIAADAGMSKAAIYRYFPNKAAVIRALAIQTFEAQRDELRRLPENPEPPEVVVSEGLRSYVDAHRTDRFRLHLRAAIRADPELSELDLADSRANADVVASYLAEFPSKRSTEEIAARALLVLELTDGLIRLVSMVDDEEATQIIDDFCRLAVTHLTEGTSHDR